MKTKLYSAETVREAHAIRRSVSQEVNLPPKAISWQSCLKSAKKGTKTITDSWGVAVNSTRHAINRYLWSGECPVNVDLESIETATGLSKNSISQQVSYLVEYGFLNLSSTGWLTVNNSKRPFPHPTFDDPSYSLV